MAAAPSAGASCLIKFSSKEFVGLAQGVRESTQSWKAMLLV